MSIDAPEMNMALVDENTGALYALNHFGDVVMVSVAREGIGRNRG
jgi:hypothetical protein